MKKLVSELKRGDKIELLYGEMGIVVTVMIDELIPQHTAIYYENGSRTFVLPTDEVEILSE
jgi:hypothetical protein